ncbi:MAG: rod shape-determining protein RodA [Burkholderiaceae bacterium]|jgi:rod shape determining protein RodA|nr:rod shape-determining protein RodA [Burkholderiaceae bacterium]MDP4968924.1 rod shape-determining protein RodA [Burkholderiaceae bacterium]MDP5110967.1 rod shape-determining protein RodA [Burkholderiaceae bacterium]
MKVLFKALSRMVTAFDWPLMIVLLLLGATGLLVMHSAVGGTDSRYADHLRNLLIALGVMWIVAMVPFQYILKLAVPFYIVGVVLLFGVEFFGSTTKGATRWLNLGFTRIQPSEMLKIAVPLMLAWYFHQRESSLKFYDFFVAGGLLIVPFLLIAKQPDLGSALLVFGAGFCVIYFAGLSFKLLAPIMVVMLVGMGGILAYQDDLCKEETDWVVLHTYQKNRVCTLLDPSNDPLGKGFHTIQSTIAVGSGGVYGKGYMSGTQTHLDFIPERTTDFIFAVFAEEFGLYGGVTLLILYLLLVFRGLAIAIRAPTHASRLLAAALTMVLFVYVFVNIGMVTGLLPVVGVPLPLLSYGGTALLTVGIACGILMSISHYIPSRES